MRGTKFSARMLEVLLLLLFILLPPAGKAQQNLDISGSIRIFSTLTDITVNMAGRSELHVTSGSNAIAGCLIISTLRTLYAASNGYELFRLQSHLHGHRNGAHPGVCRDEYKGWRQYSFSGQCADHKGTVGAEGKFLLWSIA